MRYTYGMNKLKQHGFTIVELLIVIVVIGILASITIVAYNGIQRRAQNTQLLAAFDAYEKGLRQYKTFNNKYPELESDIGIACLGGPFPAEPPFSEGECYKMNGTTYARQSSALNATLSDFLSPLPKTPNNTHTISSISVRGIMYMPYGNDYVSLFYRIPGDQQCGRGEKSTGSSQENQYTDCTVTLN